MGNPDALPAVAVEERGARPDLRGGAAAPDQERNPVMRFLPDPDHTPMTARSLRVQAREALVRAVVLRRHAKTMRQAGAVHTLADIEARAALALGRAVGVVQALSGDFSKAAARVQELDRWVRETADQEWTEDLPRPEAERLLPKV